MRITPFLIALVLVSAIAVGCATQPAATPTPPPTIPAPPALPAQTPPLEPPPKPADFRLSNLTISPSEVYAGSQVTIKLAITNLGELSGTHEVALKIDDTVEDTQQVTLAGGASQNVTFVNSKYSAKTYAVGIDDQSGTFVVKTLPTPPRPVATPPPAPAQAVPTTKDVPWTELRSFLLSANATAPLGTSAAKAGIRVGKAVLRFSASSYTVNAFNTTDYGLIYVADNKAEGSFLVWSIEVTQYFRLALPLSQIDINHLRDHVWWNNRSSLYGAQITSPTGEKLWDSPSEVTVTW